jgi:hypothetical protein
MSRIRAIKSINTFLFEQESQHLPVGKHNHIPDSKFDREQLYKGIQVEFEHTDNPEIAKAIAKDHLSEHKDYYIYLEKMEELLEKRSDNKKS